MAVYVMSYWLIVVVPSARGYHWFWSDTWRFQETIPFIAVHAVYRTVIKLCLRKGIGKFSSCSYILCNKGMCYV